MTSLRQRIAALAPLLACLTANAGEDAIPLRMDRALSESRAAVGEGRPVYGSGGELSGRSGREVTLSGDAEVRRAGTVVRGDRITYYVEDNEVVAVGAVRVVRQGNVFAGPEMRLKLDKSEGFFANPSYYFPLYGGRGNAARLDFLGEGRIALSDALYTTCRADDPDWYLRSESLVLDQNEEEASGEHASLVFKDRTILAAPWFAFSLSNARRSGLLAPTFSLNSTSGAELLLPYYWNIAPNRDFTFYPRLIQRRGVQLGGQLRFLEPRTAGDLRFEYNPNDSQTGTSRYQASLQQSFSGLGGWAGALNLRGVSDDNYFVDYARSIVASSERSLPRDLVATRMLGDWSLLMRVSSFQNILEARQAPPYERLPQVSATWAKYDLAGFDSEVLFDATMFKIPLAGSAEGMRAVAHPRIAYPIQRPGWFVVPKVGVHLSTYQLDSNPSGGTNLTRVVPGFSLDSGMYFDRNAVVFGRDMRQTLEPRLFYAFAPYRNQDAFPVFDTAEADFNFAQLFSENTFIGNDRIADVNQLTTAVVSRLLDPGSGAQTLALALGQRFYFSPQRVTIPGETPNTDTRSDILVAASAQITRNTSIDSGFQYSVGDSEWPRINVLWRYLPADGRILNLGVRYRTEQIGQIDGSWRWPLAPRWMALGRLNYSWLKQQTDPSTGVVTESKPGIVEGVLGFEYNADCWTARLVAHKFITAQGQTTSAFYLQLEFGGLMRLGTNPFDILRRNIPGYRLPDERPTAPSRFFGYE